MMNILQKERLWWSFLVRNKGILTDRFIFGYVHYGSWYKNDNVIHEEIIIELLQWKVLIHLNRDFFWSILQDSPDWKGGNFGYDF